MDSFSRTDSPKRELERLREQVATTSELLQQTESDNERLRERMAFRHRELEDVRRQLAGSRPSSEETEELRVRLVTVENAAAALARELERVEKELDATRNRYHMVMLSVALQEFDNDAIEISNEEDDLEEAVIIRDGYTWTFAPALRKVR
jgi:DNA repair exonuclease SbcCD ATPase subunit